MACRAGLAAALAPACTARPFRLEAGLRSEGITEHTQVLDLSNGKAMQGHASSRWATQPSTIHVN